MKKWIAGILTALMLLSMLPAASATGVEWFDKFFAPENLMVIEESLSAPATAETTKTSKKGGTPFGVEGSASDPAVKVAKALQATMDTTLSAGLPETLGKVLNGGSVQVTLKQGSNLTLNVNVTSQLAKQVFGMEASLTMNGSELSGGLYADSNGIAVKCDQLLGADQAYGINLRDAEKNLPNSQFNPKNNSNLAIPEEAFSQISTMLSTVEGMEAVQKRMQTMQEKYIGVAITAAFKYGEVETGEDTVTIGDTDINTEMVKVTVINESFNKIVVEVLKTAQKDEELKAIAAQFVGLMASVDPSARMDVDQLWSQIGDAIEKLEGETNLDTNTKVSLTFQISKKAGTIVSVTGRAKSDREDESFKLTLGENAMTSPEVKLVVKENSDELLSVVYTVENSKDTYRGKVFVRENGYDSGSFLLNWDKMDETFKLTVTEYMRSGNVYENVFSGTMSQKNGVTTIIPRKMDGPAIPVDISVTLNENANVTMPKYTDVLTMSESDLMNVTQTVMTNAQSLQDMIMSLSRMF